MSIKPGSRVRDTRCVDRYGTVHEIYARGFGEPSVATVGWDDSPKIQLVPMATLVETDDE